MYFSFFKPPDCRKRSVVRGRGFIQRFPMLSGGSADRTGQPLAVLPLTDVAYSLRVNIPLAEPVWNFAPPAQNYARSRGAIPAAQKADAFWAVFRPERWLRAVFLPLVLLGKIGYNSM